MKTLYILNGPSINLTGIREPEIYGKLSYDEAIRALVSSFEERGVTLICRQSNHEGDLIDWIQEAYFSGADGVVINPGAYTHTSVAIGDAIRSVPLPVAEVHLSDPDAREDFRRVNFVRSACAFTVKGKGWNGYREAAELLLSAKETSK